MGAIKRFFERVIAMVKGHGKKALPFLKAVITTPSGDLDIFDGTPITVTAKGVDQYGNPFPITVEGWVSSNPAVLSVSAAGVMTFVSVGDANINAKVNGVVQP